MIGGENSQESRYSVLGECKASAKIVKNFGKVDGIIELDGVSMSRTLFGYADSNAEP